ncbi:hypothetical protein PENTCL1PPCAC_27168, partial [Pristionchus entomophagus]
MGVERHRYRSHPDTRARIAQLEDNVKMLMERHSQSDVGTRETAQPSTTSDTVMEMVSPHDSMRIESRIPTQARPNRNLLGPQSARPFGSITFTRPGENPFREARPLPRFDPPAWNVQNGNANGTGVSESMERSALSSNTTNRAGGDTTNSDEPVCLICFREGAHIVGPCNCMDCHRIIGRLG